MEARLPQKKLHEAREGVRLALEKGFLLHTEPQSLVGFLSFAAKVVIPGRAFLRRVFDALRNKTIRHPVTNAMRLDLQWWNRFLTTWTVSIYSAMNALSGIYGLMRQDDSVWVATCSITLTIGPVRCLVNASLHASERSVKSIRSDKV